MDLTAHETDGNDKNGGNVEESFANGEGWPAEPKLTMWSHVARESAFAPTGLRRDSRRVNHERRLVDGAGLEPAASALRTRRSPN